MKRAIAKVYAVIGLAIILVAVVVGIWYIVNFLGSTPTETSTDMKVGAVLTGTISDFTWNYMVYNALVKAGAELNVATDYTEWAGYGAAAQPYIKYYADQGYSLIWCNDPSYTDTVTQMAPNYPNTIFFVPSLTGDPIDNSVVTQVNKQHLPVYLAGILAASMSKTGTIGFINSFDFPILHGNYEAFKLGAQSVDASINVLYTVVFDWSDVTKGKEAALAQIQAGADIIEGGGSNCVMGAIKAAEENEGVYIIASQGDLWSISPNTVLTSVIWDPYAYIKSVVESLRAETAVPGSLDPADAHYLAPFRRPFDDMVPQNVKDLLLDREQAIADGTLEIPFIPSASS